MYNSTCHQSSIRNTKFNNAEIESDRANKIIHVKPYISYRIKNMD